MLVLHDTTEFSFQCERPEAIGKTRIPIEEKESVRWLVNLQQSKQLANPDRLAARAVWVVSCQRV